MNYTSKKFTEKEIIVLAELLNGKTNNEISAKLFVTLHTVKAHIQSLLYKTKTKNRTQLISKIFFKILNSKTNSVDLIETLKNIDNTTH